jgi:hypothetical protein
MCEQRGKNWVGSDPVCFFDDPGKNWACATMLELRDICKNIEENPEISKHVTLRWCYDQTYVLIDLNRILDDGWFLELSWYKNRGNTEHAKLHMLDEPSESRDPAEDEIVSIIEYLRDGITKG